MTTEIFLGFNLNRARTTIGNKSEPAIDLRDGGAKARKNSAAHVFAPAGLYKITRRGGEAPGDVRYWGRLVAA